MNGVEALIALLNSPLAQAVANASQFTDLGLNVGQTSNDELMKALNHQDHDFFEEILARLDRIERRLDEHANH